MASFKDLSILASLKKTLKEKEFTTPTEIQEKAIPPLLDGKSVIGIAETGSGKTLAYVLPLLHILKTRENQGDIVKKERRPRAVVVTPTRELGEQVAKVFKTFTHGTRLRVRTILGGTKLQVAKENVNGDFEILVATPGRLTQMMGRRQVSLEDVGILVFDEADQMVDAGFVAQALKIMEAAREDRQVALFSATISADVQTMMNGLIPGVEILRTAGASRVPKGLKTVNQTVVNGKRLPVLEPLLEDAGDGGTLIFANTREQCDTLAKELEKRKVPYVLYRGEMDKTERRTNLKAFRDGVVKFLISTDLASRGLDVPHVARVINYHMPQLLENYLHRVGRTARAGRKGLVVNFVTERDADIMKLVTAVS